MCIYSHLQNFIQNWQRWEEEEDIGVVCVPVHSLCVCLSIFVFMCVLHTCSRVLVPAGTVLPLRGPQAQSCSSFTSVRRLSDSASTNSMLTNCKYWNENFHISLNQLSNIISNINICMEKSSYLCLVKYCQNQHYFFHIIHQCRFYPVTL